MNKLKKLIPCISRRKTGNQSLDADYTDEIPCIMSSDTIYERPIPNDTVIRPYTQDDQASNETSHADYGNRLPIIVSTETNNERTISDNTSIIPFIANDSADTSAVLFRATNQVNNETTNHGPTQYWQNSVPVVQNLLLIWLDNNIDHNSGEFSDTIIQLQRVFDTIQIFTNNAECVQFLESVANEKVYMIVSGALGPDIVPRIHSMPQMDSLFVLCSNKRYHEQWTKDWSKIKGVFTEIDPICEVLKAAVLQSMENVVSISFVPANDNIPKRRLDQLEPSFMYIQILKEILSTISFEEKDIEQFIDYCCEVFVDNERQLKNIKKLKQEYYDHTPIWWYTYESFLYPMLNRALRKMDVDLIIKLGFFINDLQHHIDELHKEQFGDHTFSGRFILYRGQGVTKDEFQEMVQTQGGLLSFNTFLSTSRNRDISLRFAHRAATNPDLLGIVFVMIVDPSESTVPFAHVGPVSYYKNHEQEVLFSLQTVFRIGEITPLDESQRLFQVDLTLTSDNDKDLCLLTDYIREETDLYAKGWYQLGLVLLKMGYSKQAEEVYQTLLEQTTEESEKGVFYHQLGWAKDVLGDYSEAIGLYVKAIDIWQHSLPPDHLDLASCYNNIGGVYKNMGEYSKALSYYEKALEISQQSLPSNHPDLAKSYIACGLVYNAMGERTKSLKFYEKGLEIQQQSLPPNHPDLAVSYNNMGGVHYSMGEYSTALSSYEKALAIQQQSLPPTHSDFAMSYNNLGNVYYKMSKNSKALSYHEKALEIYRQILPPTHPDLASSYNNIGVVYNSIGEYSQALQYYEKSLEIQEQSLPLNHPDLAAPYNNVGAAHENLANYSGACSAYERALEIGKRSLPANHPILQQRQTNLDRVKSNL